uniref:Vesicle-associated protein 1-1 n=1 Tax=Noccaea caerulescens TaxID=107243 RepID=A0A1J3EVY1_NOCCA
MSGDLVEMSNIKLLTVEPLCLQFHFELKKHLSCSFYLKNNSDSNVAFKVKVTDPSKYIVKPKSGVVPPRSTREVRVTMIAQKEEPSQMQIKEKFMIQSVLADLGVTDKEVTDEMFYDGGWRQVEQTILRATYDFSSTSSCKCL